MSGHSHWATIRRKKEGNDAAKGRIFTRVTREILIAAREGGGDVDSNFRLRLAVEKAKAAHMPKDNIERAIKRGTGELKGESLEEVMYEGYAPHGVAVLVEVLTDNKNRSVSEVRRTFSKAGGNMAEAGAVAWQFDRKGYISVPLANGDAERVFEVAVEAGADDVIFGEEETEIYTPIDSLQIVKEALESAGIEYDTAEMDMVAKNLMQLGPKETVQVMGVLEALEDLDDVQEVYSNLDINAEAAAEYATVAG